MRGAEQSLYEFLSEHPGIWSDRELATRVERSITSVKRGMRSLKQKGLIEIDVQRKRFNGWWIQRNVKVKENR